MNTFKDFGLLSEVPKEPFFSKPSDVPKEPQMFVGTEFRLKSNELKHLKPFPFENPKHARISRLMENASDILSSRHLKYTPRPPSYNDVLEWCEAEKKNPRMTALQPIF